MVKLAKALIRADTSNTEELFTISESVEDEILEVWNDLCELSNENKLPDDQKEYFNNLSKLMDQLRILNNLHLDSILTWEDVKNGYM